MKGEKTILLFVCIIFGSLIFIPTASSSGFGVSIDVPPTIAIAGTGNITDHNDLSNIQGGTGGEYYHITSAQHTNLKFLYNFTLVGGAGDGNYDYNFTLATNLSLITDYGDLWYNHTLTAGDGSFGYNHTLITNASIVTNYGRWFYNMTTNSIYYYNQSKTNPPNSSLLIANNITDFNASVEKLLVSTYYNLTQSHSVVGTIEGTLDLTHHQDGNYDGATLNITEEAGSPGLDVRMNFTDVEDFNKGVMRFYTSSIAGDEPIIQLWNYDDSDWEDYPPVTETSSFKIIEQSVFDSDEHLSGGVVQMRIYKSANGNINNIYYFDWFAIIDGPGTPAGEEVDPYSYHTDANIDSSEYNVTADWFKGKFNWTVSSKYASFNGANLTLDDTLLNTIFNQTSLVTALNASTTARIAALNATLAGDFAINQANFTTLINDLNWTQSKFYYNMSLSPTITIWLYNETAIANTYTDALNASVASRLTNYNASALGMVNNLNASVTQRLTLGGGVYGYNQTAYAQNFSVTYTDALNATLYADFGIIQGNFTTLFASYNASAVSYSDQINASCISYANQVNASALSTLQWVNWTQGIYHYNETLASQKYFVRGDNANITGNTNVTFNNLTGIDCLFFRSGGSWCST